jgi:4'-phosphopantetheinyl transferase
MAVLYYFNVDEIRDCEIREYLQQLPAFMQQEVMKYRNAVDQKSRLAARLMLCESLRTSGVDDWQYKWRKNDHNKPFIEGWKPFNISHSGKLVIFCYADGPIGVDIEKIQNIQHGELLRYFHPEEQKFIRSSADKLDSFYEVWVKKEAFLKATGTGLVNGLSAFNCISKNVSYEGNCWHFHTIDIHPEYKSCLCTLNEKEPITISAFRFKRAQYFPNINPPSSNPLSYM